MPNGRTGAANAYLEFSIAVCIYGIFEQRTSRDAIYKSINTVCADGVLSFYPKSQSTLLT